MVLKMYIIIFYSVVVWRKFVVKWVSLVKHKMSIQFNLITEQELHKKMVYLTGK